MNVWELHLPSSSCSGELRGSDPAIFTPHHLGKSWNVVDHEGLFCAAAREVLPTAEISLLPQQGMIVSLEKLHLDK